ncbi:MAG: Crp/Fnr family transcriptional regulator [Bacteroidota bacterium]|nr:Crp/Fnr family transcriptional regulator [Bacteroidota bacterium]
MDKENLKKFIQNIFPRASPRLDEIVGYFKEIHFAKNEYLVKEGQVDNCYLYIETGFMRAYTLDTEGNEVTTWLYSKNQIAFEVGSFINRIPSKENIQAVVDCSGWYITFDQLQLLFHTYPEFREYGRGLLVSALITLKERMLSMINMTAEQRYEQLITTRPEIFQYVSLKHIASYLGITDTSLSRIRKEMLTK